MITKLRILIYRIRKQLSGYEEPKSVNTYLGKILPAEATTFKPGQKVLTTKGMGTIVSPNERLGGDIEYIVSLRGGKMHLRILPDDLMQFVVFNDDKKKYISLSFSDYDYIVENNQAIIYRITKRGFAKLVPNDIKHYDWAKTINNTRNGLRIYQELKRKGYELKKRNITV